MNPISKKSKCNSLPPTLTYDLIKVTVTSEYLDQTVWIPTPSQSVRCFYASRPDAKRQTTIRHESLSLLYLILGLQCLKNWRNLGIIMLRGLFRASLSSSSDESSQIFCSAPNEPWDTDIHREAVKSKRKRTGTQRREWDCIRKYNWRKSTECTVQDFDFSAESAKKSF